MKQSLLVFTSVCFFAGSTDATGSTSWEIPTFHSDDEGRASDYARYFSSYADLYHQKVMLEDRLRMNAYHTAIMGNKDLFKNKVVMDVGTGSGVLAVWAAQAGAKRVYAIEYTGMAEHARNVMKSNDVDHIVQVMHGAVEDVHLPSPDEDMDPFCPNNRIQSQQVVDIIISEWMGYFLLRESMLDSVIYARDKFLKPAGQLFPSHATMFLAPIGMENYRHTVEEDFSGAITSWHEYLELAKQEYDVDMACLHEKFEVEQTMYYKMSGHWLQLEGDDVLATPIAVKTLDLATCTLEDARGVDLVTFQFEMQRNSTSNKVQRVSGLAGWFSVDFRSRTDKFGSLQASKVSNPAHLSTGPDNGATHWGQQVFYLPSTTPLLDNETILMAGTMEMMRSQENARLYNVHFHINETELLYQIW